MGALDKGAPLPMLPPEFGRGALTILAVIVVVALLIGLIGWLKVQPFLAFVIAAIAAALITGLPLADIPKTIEKFAERYVLCAPQLREVRFDRHLAMLEEATATVVGMLKELKKNNFGSISQQNSKLQKIEGDADKLMLEEFRNLYSGKYEPLTALALKDLYEILEKVFDRCRDAGNVVSHVVLKHS